MTAQPGRHERIYRGLLRAYPANYRDGYGDQMVQLFGDQLRETGAVRTWLRAVGDLVSSAASEHLRRNRTMAHSLSLAPTPATRLLGLLGVLGGAVLIAAFAVEISPANNNFRLILFNLGAMAVVLAVHRAQSAASPRLALTAAVPALLTNAVYMLPIIRQMTQPGEPAAYGFTFVVLGGAMWLSDLWFGVVTFRLGVVPGVNETWADGFR